MVKKNYQEEAGRDAITAKSMMKNKPVSLKYSTEICREIRGKPVEKAEMFLNRILTHESFLPLKRYNKKVAHRKGDSVSGVKSGRFPKKTCEIFLELIENVKANAENKGLDTDRLLVKHCFACCGFRRYTAQPKGRVAGRRRRHKSVHLEVIVQEVASL